MFSYQTLNWILGIARSLRIRAYLNHFVVSTLARACPGVQSSVRDRSNKEDPAGRYAQRRVTAGRYPHESGEDLLSGPLNDPSRAVSPSSTPLLPTPSISLFLFAGNSPPIYKPQLDR